MTTYSISSQDGTIVREADTVREFVSYVRRNSDRIAIVPLSTSLHGADYALYHIGQFGKIIGYEEVKIEDPLPTAETQKKVYANGGDYSIYEYNDEIYLKGLSENAKFAFSHKEWQFFAAVVRLADLEISRM